MKCTFQGNCERWFSLIFIRYKRNFSSGWILLWAHADFPVALGTLLMEIKVNPRDPHVFGHSKCKIWNQSCCWNRLMKACHMWVSVGKPEINYCSTHQVSLGCNSEHFLQDIWSVNRLKIMTKPLPFSWLVQRLCEIQQLEVRDVIFQFMQCNSKHWIAFFPPPLNHIFCCSFWHHLNSLSLCRKTPEQPGLFLKLR